MRKVLFGLSTVACAAVASGCVVADDGGGGAAMDLDETAAYARAEEHIERAVAALDPRPGLAYVGAGSEDCGNAGFGDDETTRVSVTYALDDTAAFDGLETYLGGDGYRPHDDGVSDPGGPYVEVEADDGFVLIASIEPGSGRLLLRARSACVAVTGASHSPGLT